MWNNNYPPQTNRQKSKWKSNKKFCQNPEKYFFPAEQFYSNMIFSHSKTTILRAARKSPIWML